MHGHMYKNASTCFEHYCARLQEDNCIYTASGIITLFGWLFSTQVTRGLSPEIAASINIHVPFSLSRIIMSALLLGIVLSVCICWFHNMVTLRLWLVSTDFGTCSYQSFCPILLLLLLLLLFYYYLFEIIKTLNSFWTPFDQWIFWNERGA